MLAASTRLGPYQILKPIGSGGMGEVYRARDLRLGRDVAVKILPEQFASQPDRLARFHREARVVAALSHPNVLAIHDYGSEGAITYAVMELLEGDTLRGRLARGPLEWRQAVEVGAAVAEGLAAAHSKGIVHRDLKPENLFVTADDRVKILDFGLAQMDEASQNQEETGPYVPARTNPGTVFGTAVYMSPEQVRGETVDHRSDIFSFGSVLYEMVTGRRAFHRRTAAETMTAVLHDEPPDPTASGHCLPPELVRLIRQCMAKSPCQRLQSARDLALALRSTAIGPARLRERAFRSRWKLFIGTLAAIFLIGAVATSTYFLTRSGRRPKVNDAAGVAAAGDALAVLPFENVGGDQRAEYLSDGVADQIISNLHQVQRPSLRIRPFASVGRYKNAKIDLQTVASELNVRLVVTGTLRQQGDDLAISVELVDAREDNRLWGGRYQGKLGGILDLQDRIAREVAASLRLQLSGDDERRLTRRGTQSPEAYLLYREAMYHFNKRDEKSLGTAIDYCDRAIGQDGNYALAYAALARCHFALGNFYQGPRIAYPKAREAVVQALKIDESLADAHSTLAALYLFHDWNWEAAEREMKQALALDANVPGTWNCLGFCQAARGRLPEALADIRHAEEAEPLVPLRRHDLAMCYNWMRRYDEAIDEARKGLELQPGFPLFYSDLGLAYIGKRMYEEAIAILREVAGVEQDRLRASGLLGYVYVKAGRTTEARKLVEELNDPAKIRFGSAFASARIYTALGQRDQSFIQLRRACDELDPLVIWLKVDPTMDELRSDPRFADILKHIGLSP
jgi:TolB-like protein/Flp pilus assembly protein TadD